MSAARMPQVVGVASGKGGVGKTTVAANLAVALGQRGHRVVLLDADLGLANAQVALGVQAPWNLSHLLAGEKTLAQLLVDVPGAPGVRLVPGASGLRHMGALADAEVAAVIDAFDALAPEVDMLVVDIAAGISPSVLAFMAACQHRLVVLQDQPASIADAYGLVKVMAQDQGLEAIRLVANMARDPRHGHQLSEFFNGVTTRFLGRSLPMLGSVCADAAVTQAQRRYRSVLDHAPASPAAADFRALARAVEGLPRPGVLQGQRQFFQRALAPVAAG